MIVTLLVLFALIVGFVTILVFLFGAGIVDPEELADSLHSFYAERDQ